MGRHVDIEAAWRTYGQRLREAGVSTLLEAIEVELAAVEAEIFWNHPDIGEER